VLAIPAAMLLGHSKAKALHPTRSSVLIDQGSMQMVPVPAPVLSPDGTQVAFVRSGGLWVRPLDSLAARLVPDTDRAGAPFWSPDGRFLAFFDLETLKKVQVSGGHPVTISESFPHVRGATWGRYDVILVGGLMPGPIYRISAAGGTPQPVTRVDASRGEIGHQFPFFLPDGQHFLYTARVSLPSPPGEANEIRVASLDGRTNKFLLYGDTQASYALGYLLFVRDHKLMAEPFDVATLSMTGPALTVADHIFTFEQRGFYSVSAGDVLMYQTVADSGARLVWLDRSGKEIGSVTDSGHYYFRPRIAPGGRAIAVDALDDRKVNRDLWIYPLSGGTGTLLTLDHSFHTHPVWSPDGQRIVFAMSRSGDGLDLDRDLYVRVAAADARNELLLNTPGDKTPTDWSPDGRFIAYEVKDRNRRNLSLWVLPLFGNRKPFAFQPSAFERRDGQFSPDGRWMAYTSGESGTKEVYLASFPEGGAARKVSVNGGSQPRWRRDGRELFYLSPDNKLMSAEVQSHGAIPDIGNVHPLFECQPNRRERGTVYDVSNDGQRFLVSTNTVTSAPPATLVTNWTAGLPQ